jgi:transposase
MNGVPDKIILLIDNLSVHMSAPVSQYASENQIEIVFNASYSSEFMAVEKLWLLVKRIVRKRLLEMTVLKVTQEQI